MGLRYSSTLLWLLFLLNVKAQQANEDVLFSVENNPVYVSEFLRVYNKNLDIIQDESQKGAEEYLGLFINYKLKLKEAKLLGYDKKPSYTRELTTYKKQLAKNFVSETKLTDALVAEAYHRILNEIKASHILIKVSENASPKDTLVAFNNIKKLHTKSLSEGFEKVRNEVHNGQTIFGEDLGYFSGFRMDYKFETMAYNTKVGEVSQPFRTRFGYHFVKVFDTRKSRGEITVAHIMVANKQTDSMVVSPKTRIQEIHKKINQGENFESLAEQFSEDKNSALKGGLLSPFSSGQLSSQEFEDAAFGLHNIGDIAAPIQTRFGWHIIKLYNKKPIEPFEKLKKELEEKVKRDTRSQLIDDALVKKLKAHYNVSIEQPDLGYFSSILNDNYFKRTWTLPPNFEGAKPLVKVGNKQFTFKDFGDYLVKGQGSVKTKAPYNQVVAQQYDAFLGRSLMQYQEDNLENENEDFAYIVSEYRDGLLLFDLMDATIWNVSKTDSLAIQNYYNNHKDNYVWQERIDAVVASCAKQNIIKKVVKLLEKNLELEQIKELVNSNDQINVIFTTGLMDLKHQAIPKNFKVKKGISKIYNHNDAFVVIQVKEVVPKKLKTFYEARGNIIGDYQVYKENNWLKELNSKYKVIVNQDALKKVKSQIKNK